VALVTTAAGWEHQCDVSFACCRFDDAAQAARLLVTCRCVPGQAVRVRVLLLVCLAERQRGVGAPAMSSVDLRNPRWMQQSGLSTETPGCRRGCFTNPRAS